MFADPVLLPISLRKRVRTLAMPVSGDIKQLSMKPESRKTCLVVAVFLVICLGAVGLGSSYCLLDADKEFQESSVDVLRSTGWSVNASAACAPYLFGARMVSSQILSFF